LKKKSAKILYWYPTFPHS